MDTKLSLLERIQSKQNGIITHAPILSISDNDDDDDDDSESDIDDDITLGECAQYVNNKKINNKLYNTSFTKVRLKQQQQQTSETLNLRDVIQQKIENSPSVVNTENVDPQHEVICNTRDNNIRTDSPVSLETRILENHDILRTDTLSSVRNENVAVTANKTDKSNNYESYSLLTAEPDTLTNNVVETSPQVKRKRTKLTAEERQALKDQKDREKFQKQKLKKQQRLEKAMEKDMEKAKKRAVTLNNRSERKDECMERLLAIVDSCLAHEAGGADILKALQDLNVRYELKDLPIASCIGFMRENVDYSVSEGSELKKSSEYLEEAYLLYKMTATEMVIRMHAQITPHESTEETFSDLIGQLQRKYSKKKITLVITGINAYYRFVKTKQNQKFRQQALGEEGGGARRKKKTDLVPLLTKQQIDNVLVELQLTTNIYIRFCEDTNSMSSFVASFAKSIAEAPFKKTNEASLRFCSSAPSDKMSVKVAHDGHGVLQLWNQQLQQFYGVRNDTATAITQVYSTPRSLIKEYETLTQSEGARLLQDIEVRRGVGVLQTRRRVGPELSKRVHKLMTSLDGDEPLAK